MKLEIITLQAVKNYGSVLQAFATQELFREHGLDVSIINYVKNESLDKNLLSFWSGKNPIKAIVILPTLIRWKKVFGRFCKEKLSILGPVYSSENDFKGYPLLADLYCTGSDQVWNSKWNNGVIRPLYLSFVPATKFKFSFAASFGQEHLSDFEIEQTKRYINEYERISVREESAKKIIELQYEYPKATLLLDPTLCVDGDFWRRNASDLDVGENYILIYNLNRSKEFDSYAKKLSKLTGLKLIRLCTRYDQLLRSGHSILIPEVLSYVNLIDKAKYVLTDSFHATAFSMNLNTEPICVYPNEFGGRIKNILHMLGSEQRHISDYNDFDVINRRVDFSKVNSILEEERQKANSYINEVIDAAKAFYN